MKLTVKNLNKTFDQKKILNDINISFEERKFYSIIGESGCGKSTLLNILSLIIPGDEGTTITYGFENLDTKKDSEKRDFRLKNIGYVFQSFNLFNNDTVYNNVLLVLDSISFFSKEMKKRKVIEVLKMVDIESLSSKYVRDLSGGEKQRVAIARALVNNPRFIFADEPTGSLDDINSKAIFEILKKISRNCTVICITHDRELAFEYCENILSISEGRMSRIQNVKKEDDLQKINFMIERKKKKEGILSNNFVFRHFFNRAKLKKFRTIFSIILLSLSLFSIGLASYLKDGITSSLKNSFSSIMSENSIVLKQKNKNISSGLVDYFSAGKSEIDNIFSEYKSDLNSYGVNYLVNFENFFKDQNMLSNISKPVSQVLEGYNARSFNEFKLIEKSVDYEMYPKLSSKLTNEEIVLSMNYSTMKDVCRYLQIVRTFEELGKYIETSNFIVNLSLINHEWGYFDNISFKVKAVIISKESSIYHTNPLFNQKVFEDSLMFPTSLNIKKIEDYPWVMKKIFYLKTKDFQSGFLDKISLDQNFENYIFDSDNYLYSPKTCSIEKPCYTNKIFVYSSFKDGIPYVLPEKILKIDKSLANYYYSTLGGYINLGSDFFSGFASQTYFSNNEEKLKSFTDSLSKIKPDDMQKINLPNDVLEGNALKTGDKIVKLSTLTSDLKSGRLPNNVTEICASSSLMKALNLKINDKVIVSTLVKQSEVSDYYKNFFRNIKLKVVGEIKTNKFYIFQKPSFSISLFRDLFQISSFDLIPNSVIYEFDEKISDTKLKKLNNSLNEYEFIDPLADFESGIGETMSYLQYILIALAVITIISSISLISIINYIDIMESKKDYAILSVLGFSTNEIIKMQFISLLIPNLVSFVFGSLTLAMTGVVLSESLTANLGINTDVYASFTPFFIMLLIMILANIIITLISYQPIKRINIVKEMHK